MDSALVSLALSWKLHSHSTSWGRGDGPVWSQGTQHGLLVPSSSVLLALEMKNKLLFGKHLLSGEKLAHKLMAVHSLPGEIYLKAP